MPTYTGQDTTLGHPSLHPLTAVSHNANPMNATHNQKQQNINPVV